MNEKRRQPKVPFTARMLVILLGASVALAAQAVPDRLERVVEKLLIGVTRHPLNDAKERRLYVLEVRDVARETMVPAPLLVAMQQRASGFRTNVYGRAGERGIMQVPARYSIRCNMISRKGQMRCGAKYLQEKYRQCGSWESAVTAYLQSSGRCTPDSPRIRIEAQERVRLWQRIGRL